MYSGVLKHLQVQADDIGGVLRSLAILTVDALDIEMSKQLASLGLFCIKPEQEITKNFGEVMPVSILLSMDPTPVKVVALDKCMEMIKRRRFTEQKISQRDRVVYDERGEDLGCSAPIQDLSSWSIKLIYCRIY